MPDDLANLCALFVPRRGQAMRSADLTRRLRDGRRIDADTNPEAVVQEAILCGLIQSSQDRFQISAAGKVVGKAQREIRNAITPLAQKELLRRVYLRVSSGARCCGDFLSKWEADVDTGTFALTRGDRETSEALDWLHTLERVGLIAVDAERALVKPEYLGAVNELLAQQRGVSPAPDPEAERLRETIGRIGEELALAYERDRLRRRGLGWLTPAIKHISPIDGSAGYDIVSCQGTGRFPDCPILIEVKATVAADVQFFWSYNERRVARNKGAGYWIYAYTNIDLGVRTGRGPVRIRDPHAKVSPPRFDVEARDVFVRQM